jgi:hypothetical protein
MIGASFKNLKLIKKRLVTINGGLFLVVSVLFIVNKDPIKILSLGLGMVFSFIIFSQLISTQEKILNKRDKNVFFPLYFLRLLLYAVPLTLAFVLKKELNLVVILLALFSFQVTFVLFELLINLKKYRKRKAKWKI